MKDNVRITLLPGFWKDIARKEAMRSLPHQWYMMEKRGVMNNFILAAGSGTGRRMGPAYSDAELHKWAEAASSMMQIKAGDDNLKTLLQTYIHLVSQAQESDGYLFTFNQIHFPETRWRNLLVEYELYSMGHLIEAAIAHHAATGDDTLLIIGRKAADLIHYVFQEEPGTPGFPEIEKALLKLFQVTDDTRYRDSARIFLELRGRKKFFSVSYIQEERDHWKRMKEVVTSSGENLHIVEPRENGSLSQRIRLISSKLSGRFFQHHLPVREIAEPEGHAVRWTHFNSAALAYSRIIDDEIMEESITGQYEHVADRKMYVTGGIGSLPLMEGFGRDYELNNEDALCRSSASAGMVDLSHELFITHRSAHYHETIEWILFNSSLVGLSEEGTKWFHRNPLESKGTLNRREELSGLCSPSDLSRVHGKIKDYILYYDDEDIYITQFVSVSIQRDDFSVKIQSAFPWKGDVTIELKFKKPQVRKLLIRVPQWTSDPSFIINGRSVAFEHERTMRTTAGGYSPYNASWIELERQWEKNNTVDISFPMKVELLRGSQEVKGLRKKRALARGPLLYCMEQADCGEGEPLLDPSGKWLLQEEAVGSTLFPAVVWHNGNSSEITFIPYFLWGNREEGWMKVWIKEY